MIEIPAIAMVADLAAQLVDFASIGTNDLCQYLCASDRMNPQVTDYYQPLSPAMVRTLHTIANAFLRAGKPLSVCGELAGNPLGAMLLAGLGVTKLSMSESSIARVKAAIAEVTIDDLQKAAARALRCKTQKEIEQLLSALIEPSLTI